MTNNVIPFQHPKTHIKFVVAHPPENPTPELPQKPRPASATPVTVWLPGWCAAPQMAQMAQGDARSYPSTGLAYLALEVKATPARGVRPQFRGHFMPIVIVFHGENIKQFRKIRWISWWTVGGSIPFVKCVLHTTGANHQQFAKTLPTEPGQEPEPLTPSLAPSNLSRWGSEDQRRPGLRANWVHPETLMTVSGFRGHPPFDPPGVYENFMSLGLPHQTQKWTNQIDPYCTWECTSPLRCKTSLFRFGHMVNYPWTPLNFDFAWWFPYVLQRLYCYWNLLCLGIGHISVSSIMAMALVPPKNAEYIGIL